jgi:hypothetical protein
VELPTLPSVGGFGNARLRERWYGTRLFLTPYAFDVSTGTIVERCGGSATAGPQLVEGFQLTQDTVPRRLIQGRGVARGTESYREIGGLTASGG